MKSITNLFFVNTFPQPFLNSVVRKLETIFYIVLHNIAIVSIANIHGIYAIYYILSYEDRKIVPVAT